MNQGADPAGDMGAALGAIHRLQEQRRVSDLLAIAAKAAEAAALAMGQLAADFAMQDQDGSRNDEGAGVRGRQPLCLD